MRARHHLSRARRCAFGLAASLLAAFGCGPGTQNPPAGGEVPGYLVGGYVTGLGGTGLVVELNGAGDLAIGSNGGFAFPAELPSGATYAVTVKQQPTGPWQTCSVANGTATIGRHDVTTVNLICSTNTYAVGGTVSGLAGSGLVLQDNLGDDLSLLEDGAFTFAARVPSGSPYSISVKTQPSSPSQTCLVTMGSGEVTGFDVTAPAVVCTTNAYAIRGTASGLSGTGLVLEDNLGDDLSIGGDGAFSFATAIASGGSYSVTVKAQPTAPTQSCVVTSGSGAVDSADITGIEVRCTTSAYRVSVAVSGLSGSGLVLQDDAGDDLAVSTDGAFAFPMPVASGGGYAVTVKSQPTAPTQTCTVSGGAGIVSSADVAEIPVTCTTSTYLVSGTVSGLTGSGLVLEKNLGDDVAIDADGAFTFPAPVASGTHYSIAVSAQPSGQACAVLNDSGVVGSGDVAVSVRCGSVWSTVAAGWSHVLAVKADGTLWAWGANDLGELGNGTTAGSSTPAQIGTGFVSCPQAMGTRWA